MDYFLSHNPNMDILQIIAANLNDWMRDHPRFSTIKSLASASGVGFGTVRRIKNGDGNPTVSNLEAIARAFRRSAIDLMTDHSKAYAPVEPFPLKAHEPNKDERDLMRGFIDASPEVREIMLDMARRSSQKRDFSGRSELQ